MPRESSVEGRGRRRGCAEASRPEQNQRTARYRRDTNHDQKDDRAPEKTTCALGNWHKIPAPQFASNAIKLCSAYSASSLRTLRLKAFDRRVREEGPLRAQRKANHGCVYIIQTV